MFDIKFYQKVFDLKYRILKGELLDQEFVFNELENYRHKEPVVYNIETTNACNMRCIMCPRTTMMTRPIETLDMKFFEKIVNQIKPFSETEWQEWENFCEKNYHISKHDMSENHFFLYVIPKVLVLHGYGSPLIDPHMPDSVKLLTERNIPSYFSDNPANINLEQVEKLFKNGLGYIKFSIESTDDPTHKSIRGELSDFKKSFKKIRSLLKIKKEKNYKTMVIITMLNLSKESQESEFLRLKDYFSGLDVYIYLKSQDQKWYKKWGEINKQETRSLHWIEFCQFPWSSMTIKSDGEAAMCVEDFNNEIILGNAKFQLLYDIWNGQRYAEFRKTHFNLKKAIKCTKACDMKLIGEMTRKG